MRGNGSKLASVALIVLMIGLGACWLWPGQAQSYNLLLITIDTLRADHLGCYGYSPASTPNIDALAKQGARFTRAYAQSPLTLPSHASILTGTNPTYHGIQDNSFFRLPKNIPTLATILRDYGYRRSAIVSGATLDRSKGLARGFSEYDDVPETSHAYIDHSRQLAERIAEKSVAAAIQQLQRFAETPQRPFFLWLHLFDPHAEYIPPAPFREKFAANPYDGEIAYSDHCLGRLLRVLERQKQRRNTIIVLLADHGEGLGQHGEASHGYFLYNTTLHIPLIIVIPGVAPAVITTPVRSIDVLPTALAAMGIRNHGQAQGRDLSPLLKNPSLQKHWRQLPVYSESFFCCHAFGWRSLHSIIEGDYKYIATSKGELYQLQRDPQEQRNLASTPEVQAVAIRLSRRLNELRRQTHVASQYQPDAGQLRQTQGLGYLSFFAADAANDKGADPAAMVEVIQAFTQAQSLMWSQQDAKAIATLQKLLQRDSGNFSVWALLGKLYSRQGRLAQALEAFERLCHLRPGLPGPRKAVLDILVQQKKYDQAEKLIASIEPGKSDAMVLSRMAYIKLEKKDFTAAATWALQATQADASLPGSWFYLGQAQEAMQQYHQAIDAYARALIVQPRWPQAYYRYALCLQKVGQVRQARQALQIAIKQLPSDSALARKIQQMLATLSKEKS